ncbi:MAG: hypothetical protein JWM32_1583 [Verrucomicrobia bacterium]|nr:hypothetical protein [Verrucomicrobiota bacterium]
MENFAPGLRESIVSLANSLRLIVFFLCVAGLIVQVNQARADLEGLVRPILKATVVVGMIATLPFWFALTEKTFLSIADTVQVDYTLHPMRAATKLRATVSGGPGTSFSLRRLGESFYTAFLYSAGKLVVLVASLLQFPFLLLQFILKLLCYLFLPVALGLFMIPSQAGLAARYVQQTLAVLAWPIGFAVTELVAYHLLTAYGSNLASAYGLQPGEIDAASFGSLLGGLLAALWIIVGTLGTPVLMQALICNGTPVASGGGSAAQHVSSLRQLIAAVKTLKTGGLAAPALAAAAATKGGAPGGGPGGMTPKGAPPPTAPVSGGVKSASPVSAQSDPSGDRRAAAALAMKQLPKAGTTL